VQFFAMLGLGVASLTVECDFPRWMSYALAFYMVTLIVLFSNFYIHAYLTKKPKAKTA
jgi:hypothetical protein